MLYTSIENKKIKDLKKLNTKKYRDKENMFLIEGPHLVLEAFKTGYLDELLLEQNELFPLDVKTSYLSNNVISYISNLETPYNIMGICHKKQEEPIGNRIVILEDIQDPGNLGTIIRSCVAFNIDTLIISDKTVDIYNDKVLRASQGMVFHLNIVTKDLLLEIPKLKDLGYKIMGTKVTHGKDIKSVEKYEKFAIIMGNEGQGMSDEISELCDINLYIDMNDRCESLNVGVATSIILYELSR